MRTTMSGGPLLGDDPTIAASNLPEVNMEGTTLSQLIEQYLGRDRREIDNWDGYRRTRNVCTVSKRNNGWRLLERQLVGTPFWETIDEIELIIRKTKDGSRVDFESYNNKQSQESGLAPDALLKDILEAACSSDSLATAFREVVLNDYSAYSDLNERA